MNKLFTKIAALALGATMAVGVGVAVASSGKEASPALADSSPATFTVSTYASAHSWTGSGGGPYGKGSSNALDIDANVSVYCTGSDGNTGKYYTDWRMYQTGSATVVVSAKSDSVKLTAITFNYGNSNSGCLHTSKATKVSAYYSSGTKKTLSNVSSVTAYVANTGTATNGQVRITSIVVEYSVTQQKEVSSISVVDNSGITWRAGDTVAADNLTVTVTYSSGSPAVITDGSGVYFDSAHTQTASSELVQGSNTVTVYYNDEYGSASNSVSITAAAAISLSNIAITTAPTKTTYNEGEFFDPTGMVVTATFSDSSVSNVTSSCSFNPSTSTALTVSDVSVTVSYTYKGVEKTASQAITVNVVQSATFTAGTDLGSSTGNNSPDSMTKSGFTVYGSDAAFAAVSSGTYTYRVYASSYITFSVSSGTLGKITIVRNGSYALSLLTLAEGETGTWNNTTGIWTGNSSSVTFDASAQFRANSFTLEKASTSPDPSVEITTAPDYLIDGGDSASLVATITNDDSYTITWSASPSTGVTFSSSTSSSGDTITISFDGTTTGTTPIVIIATLDDEDETASDPVNIYSLEHAGTLADPFSATDAQVFAGENYAAQAGGDWYVEGYVVGTYYNQYSTLKGYYIDESPTATSSTKFELYSFTNSTGKEIIVADGSNTPSLVVAHGAMTSYNGQAEFSSCTITSVTNPNLPSIVINGGDRSVDIDDSVELTVTKEYDEGASVSWSSSVPTVATVSDGVVTLLTTGSTDITASMTVQGVVYSNTITLTVTSSPVHVGDVVYIYAVENEENVYLAGISNNLGTTTRNIASAWEFEIEEGNTSGSFLFKAPNNEYLYYTGSSSYLSTNATKSNNTSWTVVNNGTYDVITNVAVSSRQIQYNYNSGNDRFAGYTGSMVGVHIVKAVAPTSVTLTQHAVTLENGASTTLTYTSDNPGTFLWTTSNDSVATVSNGVVECLVNTGTATIRIFYDTNGNGVYDVGEPTDTCVITASAPTPHFADENYGGIGTLLESDSNLNGKKVIFGRSAIPCVSGHMNGTMLTAVSSGVSYDSENKKMTVGDGLSDTGVTVFTITSVSGGYTFTTQIDGVTNYLKETTAKSIGYVTTFDSSSCVWSISISDGTATISRVGGNQLQYNTGSPRFTTYSSSQASIELYEFKSYYEEATDYADYFVGGSTGTCAATIEDWSTLGELFDLLSTGAQNIYKIATHDDPSSYSHEITVEHAVARYDDAVRKHAELQSNEFMHRFGAGSVNGELAPKTNVLSIMSNDTNTVAIIVVISTISLTAIGGYFFLRKRREQN